MGQQAEEKIRQKEQQDQAEKKTKKKRGDGKVKSNYSPEIPDRGQTSDIPGLPSGCPQEAKAIAAKIASRRFTCKKYT